jgi:hypothetical protein
MKAILQENNYVRVTTDKQFLVVILERNNRSTPTRPRKLAMNPVFMGNLVRGGLG